MFELHIFRVRLNMIKLDVFVSGSNPYQVF